ncbi:MAG: SAM-dependent methyltransferase [Kiritimatiellia bacterium]|jgi:SAM-dependent methyltransferase
MAIDRASSDRATACAVPGGAFLSDYLLGYSDDEMRRLERQHVLWGPALLGQLRRYGVGEGTRILEVGCGPGLLLEDLVTLVGDGCAMGVELGEASAAQARERLGQRAQIVNGDLLEVPLGGPWQVIVARWVFSFLPDPGGAIERLIEHLQPGGLLIIQDYDHDGLRLHPDQTVLWQAVRAARAAYHDSGGDLWVGLRLPGLMRAAGLEVVETVPRCEADHPDSALGSWFWDFISMHADGWVDRGDLSSKDRDDLPDAWRRFVREPGALFVSPIQMTVVGRHGTGKSR